VRAQIPFEVREVVGLVVASLRVPAPPNIMASRSNGHTTVDHPRLPSPIWINRATEGTQMRSTTLPALGSGRTFEVTWVSTGWWDAA
jgi:hypothetical protein